MGVEGWRGEWERIRRCKEGGKEENLLQPWVLLVVQQVGQMCHEPPVTEGQAGQCRDEVRLSTRATDHLLPAQFDHLHHIIVESSKQDVSEGAFGVRIEPHARLRGERNGHTTGRVSTITIRRS